MSDLSLPTVTFAKAAAAGDTSLLHGELKLAGRLDARFFELLRALEFTGSLHKAARTAGYSYKGAWLVLEHAAKLAHTPLVESSAGGRGGGGSRLTTGARQLMAAWAQLQQRHADFLRTEESWLLDQPGVLGLLRRLAIMTTARNQFAGKVLDVDAGLVSTLVTLGLAGQQELSAALSTAAAQRLGMAVGGEAIAVVKASEVMLVTGMDGWRLSARNQLAGTIARIDRGAVGALVGVTLPGGAGVTASVTLESVDALGLAVGQPATATFKAHAVMLARA